MKNISATNYRNRFPVIALFILTAFTLWADVPDTPAHPPARKHAVSERRGDFFLVRFVNDTAPPPPGTNGQLYRANGKETAGTCKILAFDKNQNCVLCRIESLRPSIDDTAINRVSFRLSQPSPPPVQPLFIMVLKIRTRFVPVPGFPGYFLNRRPIPISGLPSMDIAGIKEVLYQIEKNSGNRYGANLIDSTQVIPMRLNRRLDFSHQSTILLGIHNGKLNMFHEADGAIQHTPITANTLKSFKKDMYFYVLLKKTSGKQKGKNSPIRANKEI